MSEISKPCPTCHNEMKDMGCGHSPYWRTIYDGCMACRATKAEAKVALMEKVVEAAKELASYRFGTTFNNHAGYDAHEAFLKAIDTIKAKESDK